VAIRNAVIILFGAVPATVTVFIAAVAFGLYRFHLFGPGPFSALLGILWFGMALWGTGSLWFSLFKSASNSNTIGLTAGLLALIPGIYLVLFELSDSLEEGLIMFGWILLPALVAISLLVTRVCRYRRRR